MSASPAVPESRTDWRWAGRQLAASALNGLNVGQNRDLASGRKIRLAPRSGERPTREARRRGARPCERALPLSLALSSLSRGEGIGQCPGVATAGFHGWVKPFGALGGCCSWRWRWGLSSFRWAQLPTETSTGTWLLGARIVHQRAMLRFDSFTVSAAGRPWVDVHWLFQLGAYALYALFGFTGLAIAKAALIAGGATLLVRVAEISGGALARGVGAVAVLGGLILDRHLVPMRPLIVTLVMLAVFLLALERLRTARARWAWVVLPLAQAVWCKLPGAGPARPSAGGDVPRRSLALDPRDSPLALCERGCVRASSARTRAWSVCAGLVHHSLRPGCDGASLALVRAHSPGPRQRLCQRDRREHSPLRPGANSARAGLAFSNGSLRSWPPPSRLFARASTWRTCSRLPLFSGWLC